MRRRYLGAIVSALSILGVSAAPSHAIVNGGTEVVESGSWPWMVGVEIDSNGALIATCSGVLIGPTTVLTAAHCVDPNELGFRPTPADVFVTSDRVLQTAPPGDFVAVTSYLENPAFDAGDLAAGNDESVLQLAAQPSATTPIPVLQPADVNPFSAQLTGLVAGYGLTVPNNPNSYGRLYQTEVVDATYGVGDITVDASPAYTCFGDSGGPLVVNLDGATLASDPTATNGSWAVIGLTSYGDSTCSSTDGFANVVNNYGFISAAAPFVASQPYNSIAPTLQGSPVVGSQVTCDPGQWSGATALSYQWITTGAGGGPIAGADQATYAASANGVGSTVACEVSAAGSSETIAADSAPVTIAATVPAAPSAAAASAGDGEASVSFVAPDSDGGDQVTSYVVTSVPSAISATGTTSPVIVTGLSPGVSYSFTVAATNAVGTGLQSAPSSPVVIQASGVVVEDPSRVADSGKALAIRIRCAANICDGSANVVKHSELRLRLGSRWVTDVKTVTLASGSFDLPGGASIVMRLWLTAAGRHDLAAAGRHPLAADLVERPLATTSSTFSFRLLGPS